MAVKLPYVHTSRPSGAALQRAIANAAAHADIQEHDMADHMTYFLEAIVDEVCKGECVAIPGFGVFGPFPIYPLNEPKYCLPRFIAANGFRFDVKLQAPPREENRRRLAVFRRNNNRFPKPGKMKIDRSKNSMKRFRQTIEKDARQKRLR